MVLSGVGIAMVVAGYVATGYLPIRGPAAIIWAPVALRLLRMFAGLVRRDSGTPPAASSLTHDHMTEPTPIAASPAFSAAVEEEELPRLTPLEFDYWLLGLPPDATFREVKSAYWQSMARQRVGTVDRQEAFQLQAAYRRLRHIAAG